MAETAIWWVRRDLRVRDVPALHRAAQAERTVPVFVFDDRLLTKGRFPSGTRTAFMLGCLAELDAALRERGAGLVIRHGRPEQEIPKLAAELGARDVTFTADASPWARGRDQRVINALAGDGVRAHALPGAFIVDDPSKILTKQGRPYSVFSPFARAWAKVGRRDAVPAPRELRMPSKVTKGRLPKLADLGLQDDLRQPSFEPGEEAGRRAVERFLRSGLGDYSEARNTPSGGSSRTSPYLRWGCVSPLWLDERVAASDAEGAGDFRTELAWRDFYGMVLMQFPFVVRHEFAERYRGTLEWAQPGEQLEAWKQGRTGFPLVDAGMRELLATGWMHNRVRMVVGSFLTKDLHLDWRLGEAWFMERLLDGDMAANNGGWQWIASTGTDPAPYFQRLFNPVTQQQKFDPQGEYVRRWVPELADVPAKRIAEPWTMSDEEQEAAGCRIGTDYPEPIVDHAVERRRAIERYRAVAGQ
jgi:deoxyribodipyrimidine photo-lyase